MYSSFPSTVSWGHPYYGRFSKLHQPTLIAPSGKLQSMHAVLVHQQYTATRYMQSLTGAVHFGSGPQVPTISPVYGLPGISGNLHTPIAIPATPDFPTMITDPGPGLLRAANHAISTNNDAPQSLPGSHSQSLNPAVLNEVLVDHRQVDGAEAPDFAPVS